MRRRHEIWEDQLEARGFAQLGVHSTKQLIEVAEHLGRPIEVRPGAGVVQLLRPTSSRDAPRRSLSALHGTGSFPMHTDGAHLRRPPRYVVLRCTSPGSGTRRTFVADWRSVVLSPSDAALLRRAVYIVDGGSRARPFLTSIVGGTPTAPWDIRYDTGCMRPAHPSFGTAGAALDEALTRATTTTIKWSTDCCVVIDNWRCLHARGGNGQQDRDRALERVTVA